MQRVLHALPKNTSARAVINLGTSQLVLHEKSTKTSLSQAPQPKAHKLTAGTIQAYDSQSESEGSDNSLCLQLQIKHVQAKSKIDQKPACLITNLVHRLNMHENRNLDLRAKLDTCTDVNIMPASEYKLVFHDPNLENLTANKLQIGTCTNDTVKIVGTCKLYLVHPGTKKLVETIF